MTRTRRIHLVWQLQELGDELSVKDLLDEAYEKDAQDCGYMLRISLYYEKRSIEEGPAFGGSHGRYVCYSGTLDVFKIIEAEVDGEYDIYSNGQMERRRGRQPGDILVSGMMLNFDK
ncbi:MAG: hypothetical protein Q9171_002909 [Xanthocarpia ochracea]